MDIADFILAGEGDLYDMNEYHMLAHLSRLGLFGSYNIIPKSTHGCALVS